MADLYVNLKYGNLSHEQNEAIKHKSLYDHVVNSPRWAMGKYPEADSVEMLKELNEIVDYQATMTAQDLSVCQLIDEDLAGFYVQELGADAGMKKQIERIIDAINPAILKVKARNQRPRPYQVAMYLDVSLHPYESFSGHSPSWPSGHSCQARMLTLCLSEMYPDQNKQLLEIENVVHNSRILMGLHYSSDIQAGVNFATQMFEDEKVTSNLLQGVFGYI